MSRIVLATASHDFEERVRHAFAGSGGGDLRCWTDDDLLLVDARRRLLDLSEQDPELVVLGPDVPVQVALDVARTFDESRPEISVIVIAQPTPELWQQALRVGVRDILAPDTPELELRRSFDHAMESAARRRAGLVPGSPAGSGPPGRVITVLSPKGGAGKTTVASNLAVRLAQSEPGDVVLVDLDLQFGDITYILGLEPEHTFADATRTPGVLDATTLKVFLTARNGLYVLCAPDSPAEGEEIGEPTVDRVIELLRARFPYVVVDTSAGLSEHTLTAMERSTDFVMVADLSFTTVRGMRRVVEALDQLKMTSQQRHLVLNRADSKVAFDAGEVAAFLGMTIDVEIPSTRDVPLSMNQGTPVVEMLPRSAVARAVEELAGRFAEVHIRRGGFLQWRRAG